jgi:hypothetical protein
VFAYADRFDTLGVKYRDSPVVCIFEPNPEYTSSVTGVINTTENAINNWEYALNKYSPNGNWDLMTFVIPFEYHDGQPAKNYTVCNIMISFEEANWFDDSLGYASIDFSNSSHKFIHIISFLNGYDNNLKINMPTITIGENTTYDEPIAITLERIEYPLIGIQNILSHEFGHGLGLGHYSITDAPIVNPWDRSIMYYAVNPFNEDELLPTYADVKLVEKIYGDDGFGGSIPAFTSRVNWYTVGDVDICSFKCNK